jgi:hypothetical protein
MADETYLKAMTKCEADLAAKVQILGQAELTVERTTKEIMELRRTLAALRSMCGHPEFIEEDALGLTDAIRMAYKSAAGGGGLLPQDVKDRIESMGYAGRWGNLLASVHTVTKRLFQKGELEAAGNINGRDTYRWAGKSLDPSVDKASLDRKLATQYLKRKTRPN